MMLRKDEKTNLKLDFVNHDQIDNEMDELLVHYGVDRSLANLHKTRITLKRFGSVNEELVKMRNENR